ncbi:MAG: sugar ABC transporter substrate-binding protein [Nitrososphaerota archaeon]
MMTQRSKRNLIISVVVVLIVGIAIGATLIVLNPSAPAKEKVVMIVMSGPEAEYIKKAAEVFNAEAAQELNVQLEIVELGRDQYFDKVKTALLGRSKEFDIAWLINLDIAQYAKAGVIEPLDGYISDRNSMKYDINEFLPIALEGVKYKGKTYAIPLWISTMFLYYRTDLVSPNEIDEWDKFIETAKRFTKSYNPNSSTDYGTTIFGAPFVTMPMEWYIYLWSYGGEIIKDGLPVFNNPAGLKAANTYYQLVKHGIVPPDWNTYEYPKVLEAIKNGKVAFGIQWDAAYFEIKSALGDKVEIMPPPAAPGGKPAAYTHTWTMVINGASDKKAAAFKVMTWLTLDDKGAQLLGSFGLPIPTRKVLTNPTFKEKAPHWEKMYNQILNYGHSLPVAASFSPIQDRLIFYLSKMLSGELTPQDALNKAAEEAVNIMKEAGEYGA